MNFPQIVVKRYNNLLRFLFFFVILRLMEIRFEFNLPLVRYAIILYCTFLLFKTISISEFLLTRFKGVSAFLIIILFGFLIYSFFIGLPEITDSSRDYIKLKQFIGEKALLFSLPLLLFIRPNLEFWKVIIKHAYMLLFSLIPFLLLDLVPYLTRDKSPEHLIRVTAGLSGFLLLISPYFKNKRKIFIGVIYFISLLFMVHHARRNMVLYFGSFLVFYFYMVFFSNTVLLKIKRLIILRNSLFFVAIVGILFIVLKPDFSLMVERTNTGMESRDGVIIEFFSDIVPFSKDFYLGRGLYGTFLSIMGDDVTSETKVREGERSLIENGYLMYVLNFGSIFLLAFVVLSFISFYLGFVKSKNILAKSCGALLFINLIDMIGYGIPELTFRYLLIWFSFSFCLSRYFRNLTDLEIKNLVFAK